MPISQSSTPSPLTARQHERHSLLTVQAASAVGLAWGRGDWCHVADAAIAAVCVHLSDAAAGVCTLDKRLAMFVHHGIPAASQKRLREMLECSLEQVRESEGCLVSEVYAADASAIGDALLALRGSVTAEECLADPSAARLGG